MSDIAKGRPQYQKEGVFDRVKNLLLDVMPEEYKAKDVSPEDRLDELGFNSIQFINLILHLEDIVDNDLEDIVNEIDVLSMVTVDDLVKFVETMNTK